MKKEVHLQDFLILEALRIVYPDVYEDMSACPWMYLPAWGEAAFISFPYECNARDDRTYIRIKKHIETLCEKQEKPEVLLELLQILFFEVRKGFFNTPDGHDDLEPEYRRHNRLSHPEVFWKYFTRTVPATEVPDHVVESFIVSWNGFGQDELKESVDPHLSGLRKRTQPTELWQKRHSFLPTLTRETSAVLIKCLHRNMHFFRKEGTDIFQDSESSAAIRLLFDLIDNKLFLDDCEVVLSDLVQKTPSLELAIRIADNVRSRMGDVFNIPEQGNFDALSSHLDERLTAHFIEGRRNIFNEEKNYGYILAQWGTYQPHNNLKVNEYVFGLVEEDPTVIGKVLVVYTSNHRDQTGVRIKWEDLVKVYDEKRLYERASQYHDASYSTEDERKAVEIFMSQYEKRKETAEREMTRQSNKQKFMETNSQGVQLFKTGQYKLALEAFNRASAITDWNDEFHWIHFLKLQQWHTLLELGLNSDGDVRTQFLSSARKIASDDVEIRDLFKSAFPKGAAQATQELYCCIFYYLQWEAASVVEKDSMENHFEAHFSLATGQETSGGTGEITKRCSELLVLLKQ
ncbi:hypothetical protein [uncultured Nitrospira sp.]|uniref:hypothetical protein n=1 Tax=uncultured Nitrospira sp. TaxID=157176 RepID=UPI00313FFF30